ncbi:hypothetical protein D9M68_896580 [compost metagenome]
MFCRRSFCGRERQLRRRYAIQLSCPGAATVAAVQDHAGVPDRPAVGSGRESYARKCHAHRRLHLLPAGAVVL